MLVHMLAYLQTVMTVLLIIKLMATATAADPKTSESSQKVADSRQHIANSRSRRVASLLAVIAFGAVFGSFPACCYRI